MDEEKITPIKNLEAQMELLKQDLELIKKQLYGENNTKKQKTTLKPSEDELRGILIGLILRSLFEKNDCTAAKLYSEINAMYRIGEPHRYTLAQVIKCLEDTSVFVKVQHTVFPSEDFWRIRDGFFSEV